MTPEPARESRAARTILGIAAALVLVLLITAAWRWLSRNGIDVTALSSRDVEALVARWGAWAWAGSIALMVLHSFLPLPAEVIAVGNGMLFGAWQGVLVTWTGAMLGAALAYGLARALGRPVLRWVVPARHRARLEGIPTEAPALLAIRLMPVISFNLVNYAAGVLGVPWWRFLWTTGLGILPLVVTMVVLGREMTAAPWWLWAGFALVCVALLLALWRRKR